MKKFFIMVMAVAAIGFTSCGNKSAQNAAPADETEVSSTLEAANTLTDQLKEKIEEGDCEAIGATIQSAVQELSELVANGNSEAAKQYQEKIKDFVNENAEKIKEATGGDETVGKLIDSFVSVPVKVEDAIDEAGEALKDGAEDAVEDAKDAAADKVDEIKDAAADKVDEMKDDAAGKVDEMKAAAAEKAEELKAAAAEKAEELKSKMQR